MFLRVKGLIEPCAFAVLCMAAIPCFSEVAQSSSINANLTPVAVKHTVECPVPNQELCLIKKPVGAGYRTLTLGINLEDAGEYWIADFTKTKPAVGPKASFRVMGKDHDIHEIEVSFKKPSAAKAKPVTKKAPPIDNPAKEKSD